MLVKSVVMASPNTDYGIHPTQIGEIWHHYDVIHAKSKLLGVGNSDECEFGKRSEINSWG